MSPRLWWTQLRDGPGQPRVVRTADPERDADRQTTAEGEQQLEFERRERLVEEMLADPVELVDLVALHGSLDIDEALGAVLAQMVAREYRTELEQKLVDALRAAAMAEVLAREGDD